jgi:hypothetical protein
MIRTRVPLPLPLPAAAVGNPLPLPVPASGSGFVSGFGVIAPLGSANTTVNIRSSA